MSPAETKDQPGQALLDLAARCEKATGPDRELDARIQCALDGHQFVSFRDDRGMDRIRTTSDGARDLGVVLHYTASLDAAMTLVPPGYWLRIDTGTQVHAPSFEWPVVSIGSQSGTHKIWKGQAKTLPITICAASLRALSLARDAADRRVG